MMSVGVPSGNMANIYPRGMVILSGNSHPVLSDEISRKVGVPLCNAKVERDAENETQVEIIDSIRGKDVFIIQTGYSCKESASVNDTIMEMLIMCYACKTSSARKVIGVIPFLPYSKQSKMRKRGCITAKLLASMLSKAGMSHIITMDLYVKELQGFFDFPVDNLRCSPFLIQHIKQNIPDYRNAVIVARYPGVTRRATSFAERLHLRLAVIHGEPKGEMDEDGRNSPPPSMEVELDEDPLGSTSSEIPLATAAAATGVAEHTEVHVTMNLLSVVPKEKPPLNVVGDVHARIAIIVDDIIDDMEKIIAAAKCLQERGAYKIYVVATHGIFCDNSCELLSQSPITEVIVTNTVFHNSHGHCCSKIRSIDISILLAEAIRRTYHGESMSYLFRNIPLED